MTNAGTPSSSELRPLEGFHRSSGSGYSLMPLRFIRLDGDRYVVTSFAGKYIVLPRDRLHDLVRHKVDIHSDLYNDLKSKHLVMDGESPVGIDRLASQYRTKQSFLSCFTSLFQLVTTLRCNLTCSYCQVSHRSDKEAGFDMTEEIADKAIEFIFRSPSPCIRIEFQGGESLLNFPLVQYIVTRVQQQANVRNIEFAIATNLVALSDDMLKFCSEHNVCLSTSLDGPRELHDHNRPCGDHGSYDRTVAGIRRARDVLGIGRISALMTTTRASLRYPEEIVDEYVSQGFSSVFLRPINPYGLATGAQLAQYTVEEWLEFYRSALAHILELNYQGIEFREQYSTLLVRRMLAPFATSYVDLQSPAGLGISGIVVNYDGDVYASDESRMLGEMGDHTFRLGNIMSDRYEEIMLSDFLLVPVSQTMTECVPGCADCGFQPYCGSDPVGHYRTQGDIVGFKPTSDFCKRNMAIMRTLIRLLEDDAKAAQVLRMWSN
jgi:uncharacterized protein